MSRGRLLVVLGLFGATLIWLRVPEPVAGVGVLWPSALAVVLAFVTRDIYLSLFLGAFSGALLLHRGDVWAGFVDLFRDRLIPSLMDRWNVCVVLFTLMMGGFVEVLNRNGGMAALAYRLVGRAGSRRRAGMGAYMMGWAIFFDGLANAMVIGKTLRPVADRAGLSREKLAFIVDSTSSPIAGLALLSTWVAYEMSVIQQGFANVEGLTLLGAESAYTWLVWSLPFRFYNWFVLLLVFLVIWMMRDYGPMWAAERASQGREAVAAEAKEAEPSGSHVALALVPLAVLLFGVLIGLFVDGGGLAMGRGFSFQGLVQAFGRADAALVFVLATAGASVVALALSAVRSGLWTGGGPGANYPEAFLDGMQQMFRPVMILGFAWMLNSVIKELGTAGYLVSLLGERFPAAWLPALVFLLASVVSFSTGTSWGTMAVVMPLAIPVAVRLSGFQVGSDPGPVLVATVGAVLAGAVFGDHCSPMSDTTVVSAFSSDCEVVAHVRTQLPYAVTAAGVAVVFGYGPAGYGVSPWVLLPVGGMVTWLVVRAVGRPIGGRATV